MKEETIVQKRIAKMVQVEMATILQREVQFSQGKMLSVTVVRMSRDLEHAKLYISVFPETDADKTIDFLNVNRWEIRKFLSARIRHQLKKMPEIVFFLDDTPQEVERIEKLFDGIEIPEAEEEEEE